mgnify:CR=1 FL=1
MAAEKVAKLQQVVNTERRPARRKADESIGLYYVREVGRKGLQRAVVIVKEDPVFSPIAAPDDELKFAPEQRMEWMYDPEPTRGSVGTTCS